MVYRNYWNVVCRTIYIGFIIQNILKMDKTPMTSFFSSPLSLSTPMGNPEFVEELKPMNRCQECTGVLRNAVQLPCGHLVCEECLNSVFVNSNEKLCEYEGCGYLISKTEIFPDAYRRREILNLLVYCPNKKDGCSIPLRWKQLEQHERSCDYRRVPCPYSNKGCCELIVLKQMERHQTSVCLYGPVVCTYCKETMLRHQYEDHIHNICTAVSLSCPYTCGLKNVTRDVYNSHVTTCELKPHSCSYSCIGCQYTGKRKDVIQHEQTDFVRHIYLLKQYTKSMEEKTETLKAEILSLKEENNALKSHVGELEEILKGNQKELSWSKQNIKELTKQMASQGEKLICIEGKLNDKADTNMVEREMRNLNDLKETLQQLMTQVSTLERAGLQSGENSAVSEQLATLIRRIDQQCSLHDVRLAELDLRFQILETANYDGVLMWKIKDFKRRFKEAKEGKTLSLFSQPFYTNKHGYRMCGRLYLNGDGIGKGKFLSFFFVIMRGDYDNLLSWPFRHTVSLMLLDQDRRVQNICDTFTPDQNSNSFQKPVSEMNVASGVPCFMEHSKLFNERTYLQDDTIYLKIKVAVN